MSHRDVLLKVEGLKTYFYTDDGVVQAVDGVDLEIRRGETVGLVGESGCGKSVTALSILRLVSSPPGRIVEGAVWLGGEDLLEKTEEEMRHIRGGDISMIFQEPMTSLNPVFKIGHQMSEVIQLHQGISETEARAQAIHTLELVRIPDAEAVLDKYPHALSGGMRQRVMIAMALSCNPALLIADEPTTALDVTIQAQILALIKALQEQTGTAVLLITHDLGVVAQVCDRVGVMYAGHMVEFADAEELFENPQHPYTQGLLGSIPSLDREQEELAVIPGVVPNLANPPAGCRYHTRCPYTMPACQERRPPRYGVGLNHWAACFLHDPVYGEGKELREDAYKIMGPV